MARDTTVLLDGLAFPEGPRWRDGRLFFSDMHDRRVLCLDPASSEAPHEVLSVPGRPSGLGWAPDGSLLVVSMTDRRLLRLASGEAGGRVEGVGSLGGLASFHCNDMVVDALGRPHLRCFGFDLENRAPLPPGEQTLVTPEGEARVVAERLAFPNGSVITPDGRTLIVGETFGACLTAFDIAADGSLGERRAWAKLDAAVPDGICLDEEGAIWVASPVSGSVLRVREGGEVAERVEVENQPYACMLGGPERRTLFICTALSSDPRETTQARAGRIETVEVNVPGAGLP